jgi:hypothetical protein
MRTKVIAALLAVLTALGGLNLFQSIKQKLQPNDEAVVEVVTVSERDGITVREEGNRIVIRTSAVSSSEADAGTEEVMISERFTVKEGATLRVDVSHAEFQIVTGSGNEASVEVTLDSNRMGRARERFEEMNWSVEQRDGDIIILADDPRGWSNFNMDIDVKVHIPARFNIDMETSHGDIWVGDLEGELSMLTSHGDVELGNIHSSRMWVKSSHGDIAGKALRASVIELETSHADLEFESIESEEFNARTSHADIDIDRLRGAATLRTSHGDVDVELIDELGADIETQHGDVSVRVTKDARFDLDLQGAEVEVSSALRVNGRVSEDRVDGSINGGGQVLRVRTTHGEVVVR